jgi:hypothetical protein
MRDIDRWRVAPRALSACAALLPAVSGCDGRPAVDSSATEQGTVHSRVTLDGKPVTAGEVVFNPANYQGQDSGHGQRCATYVADWEPIPAGRSIGM